LLPIDTIALLEADRGLPTGTDRHERLDWSVVRDAIRTYGMRNSNTMAIAPTATISNIAGTVPGIEPIYKNIYVKSNISGDFIVVNQYLVEDLKALGLWNLDMLDEIKLNDGSIQSIASIPAHLKEKYRETFEIDMRWLVRAAAARGKWIDQSQSLNIFFAGTSGKELSDLYVYAWEAGLKTTYYLRSLGASQVEKSTIDAKGTQTRAKNDGPTRMEDTQAAAAAAALVSPVVATMSAVTVEAAAIPSPMATPSPFTKEVVKHQEAAVAVEKPKRAVKLHVAEEAICEACQ
jgi:ribonucleoside-diphosphate reductase alpha chain